MKIEVKSDKGKLSAKNQGGRAKSCGVREIGGRKATTLTG